MQVAGAFGLRPIYHPSGLARPRRLANPWASGKAVNIFANQPIMWDSGGGTLTPVTGNTNDFLGVLAGVEYTPLGGRPTESEFWPSGTVIDTTQPFFAYYYDDPNIIYEIQADGSVTYTATVIGGQLNLTNFASGSTGTGLSACTVGGAQVAASSQGQLRIVDQGWEPGNAIGDVYLNVQAMIARHQYLSNKVAP